MFLQKLLLLVSLVIGPTSAAATTQLPKVDLGYVVQQANSFNSTIGYYNFSNIRYAQPPVGDLRFAAPVPPTGKSKTVNKGGVGSICPQSYPAWVLASSNITDSLALGLKFNATAALAQWETLRANPQYFAAAIPPDPRTSEDCLFLDVIVPKGIFDNQKKGKGAAVLVWIYGGGYTAGHKGDTYDPSGLIKASQSAGSPGVIYVAMNYRLGAMGWSVGPTFQAEGGTPNAGLYDQRLALEWVKSNIHLFGGDPNRVTVFGESAGGGSVMHQITAFGGLKPVPFQQALPQSPGFLPYISASLQDNSWNNFLKLLNVTTLEEARKLPSKAVIQANALQIAAEPIYGSFIYGPAVDGYFVPGLPGRMLAEGHFAKNLKVMTGHNAVEGAAFANPGVTKESQFRQALQASFPGIPESSMDTIQNVLYPAKYDGSLGYKSQFEREILIVSESSFTCNTYYLDRAFGNKTYSYQFSIPPAFHGQDVAFTFYNGNDTAVFGFPKVAVALQEYITSFAETGVPSAKGALKFPMYGPNAQIANLNVTGVSQIKDPNANKRCLWWQQGLLV